MLSQEAIVALVALLIAVPPALAVIWRWYKNAPAQPGRQVDGECCDVMSKGQ